MRRIVYMVVLAAFTMGCGQKKETAMEENNAVKVKTITIEASQEVPGMQYSGTIEAWQTIPLTFQSGGIVTSVKVEEGDKVSKGQILATVDNGDNQSVYDASRAKYEQAKDAYDRLKTVHDKGSLTEIKWVEMETNLKQAESQMNLTKSSLDKCIMRAPDNGMIGRRNIEPGQSALTTASPIELVKIDKVLVKFSVPENEISKVKKGMKASFSISALDGKTYEAIVSHVGIVADPFSRTYEAKLTANNPSLEIKPGMVCNVILQYLTSGYQIIVPQQSIQVNEKGEKFVYVANEGAQKAEVRFVEAGALSGNGVVITTGLQQGDKLIVEGYQKISENTTIQIVK